MSIPREREPIFIRADLAMSAKLERLRRRYGLTSRQEVLRLLVAEASE